MFRCGCGRIRNVHSMSALSEYANKKSSDSSFNIERWSITKHTAITSTDAFGTIEFQGT